MMLCFGPASKRLFAFFFHFIIFGSAGGIKEAETFQRIPEITYQKPCQGPEGGVEQTGLMSMSQIQGVFRGGFRAQNKSFFIGRISLLDDIMVTIEKVKTALCLEPGKQTVGVLVDLGDGA